MSIIQVGDHDPEPMLSSPDIAIPRMINSVVADLDELCAAANRPETAHIIASEAPAFGQIVFRCNLILSLLDARKTPKLKMIQRAS